MSDRTDGSGGERRRLSLRLLLESNDLERQLRVMAERLTRFTDYLILAGVEREEGPDAEPG